MLDQGYWIMPNKVLYAKDLSDKQKILYVLINSHCAKKWYCYASNKYIASKLWYTAKWVSECILSLINKWYLRSSVDQSAWNKRKIYLEKPDTYPATTGEGIPLQPDTPIPLQPETYNNTSNNITKEYFEKLRKLYLHTRPWKKEETFQKRKSNGLEYEEVRKQILFLKIKVKYWLEDPQYIPAMQRRIGWITALTVDVYEPYLKKILVKYLERQEQFWLEDETIKEAQREILAIRPLEEIKRITKIIRSERDRGIVLVDDNWNKHLYK